MASACAIAYTATDTCSCRNVRLGVVHVLECAVTTPQRSTQPRFSAARRWLGSGEGLGLVGVVLVGGCLLLALVLDANGDHLYEVNEYVVWFLMLIVLGAVTEAGYWLGRRAKAQMADAAPAADDHTREVQTAVFAVLGLLLAFTYAMAVSRFDDRKQALTAETTAIQTAYLRTQLLPAPLQATEAALLRQFVDLRLASARPDWNLDTRLRQQTQALQQQMWTPAAAAAKQDPQSNTLQIFVESLNDVITAQRQRDAARLNHLPGSALYLLFAVSALSVGILGYRSGLGSGRSALGAVLLVSLVATILVIIFDIDHPYQGLITISQQSLIDLRRFMGTASPSP